MDIDQIIKQFEIKGPAQKAGPFGNGHINDSFRVYNADPSQPDYLLQKVNHKVFTKVDELMENIQHVTEHLQRKLKETGEMGSQWQTLVLVKPKQGGLYVKDGAGDYWRMFHFIKNSKTCEVVDSPELAYEGGKAFGKFLAQLSDYQGPALHETIPHFHDIERRLHTLFEQVEKDPVGRVGLAKTEIAFARERAGEMPHILCLGRAGKIPLRITHNDTKFNNVLLDANNRGLCVIDLDTVMPGYAPYDFGDAVRTAANTAAEDEEDLQKVGFNFPIYQALAEGFLDEARQILNPEEIACLAFSGKLFTYLMGVRFLTDFIMGDVYYKTHFPGHNLRRAKNQFKYLHSTEKQYAEMQLAIKKLAK